VKPALATSGPLLETGERERFPWLLFACVLLSFIAHTGSFLLFQVVYPQQASVPPPPPQVQLLTPETPQYAAIMSWVDAEDPALTASAHGVRPANLLEAPYRPSYAVQRTAPRGVPERPVAVQFPAARRPLEIIRSAEPRVDDTLPPPGPLRTQWTLSPGLRERTLATPPDLAVAARTASVVEPSRYLIGVSERGDVRFVFLQQTSGNPDLDAAGARNLSRAVFAEKAGPTAWGHATIAWGDEVIAAQPPAKIPATP